MSESTGRINWPAIVVLVVVQQGIGAGWYTVFSDAWMSSLGYVPSDFDDAGYAPYIISIVLSLILTYGMARFWLALGTREAAKGAAHGFILWLTFVFTYQGVHTGFELISDGAILNPVNWIQMAIDTGMSLVVLVLTGAVLAGWRKE